MRRGLYASVPLGASPQNCGVDPFLIAAKVADDSVLAYHTALEFHGKAHSVHRQFLYLTHRSSRPFSFRGARFRGLAFPAELKIRGAEQFGVKTVSRAGIDVRATSLERTLLLDNATTVAKVGFYLEQHRSELMVQEHHLGRLRERRPQKPHYLSRTDRQSGRLVSRWNLVVPDEVIGRRWQEVA